MRIVRSQGDAPRDYTAYPSLADAEMEQAARARRDAVVRRVVEPQPQPVDEYGTRQRRTYQRQDEVSYQPRTGYNAQYSQPNIERRRRAQPPPEQIPPPPQPMPRAPQQPAPQQQYMRRAPQPEPPQADAFGQPFDTPYQVLETREQIEEEPREKKRSRVPWALILAAVIIALGVVFFVMGNNYDAERVDTIMQREEAERALLERYTLSYQDIIDREATKHNLNPAFVAAIIRTESHFDPDATSSMGARGLMQLMEDTASWVSGKLGEEDAYSFDRMYDADTNLRYGCWYLGYLSDQFAGDPICVAAAYHTGHNWMRNILNNSAYSSDGRTVSIDRLPDESTRSYAQKVLDAYAVFRQKYGL